MIDTPYDLPPTRRPELVPAFVRALGPAADGDLAVFDADGCLWVNDVADDFTCWMIAQGHVPGERWPRYLEIYRDDHPAGCRFLLSLFAGLTPERLQDHVRHYWLHHAHRQWIPEVVEVLHHLAEQGFRIWVVSGTPTDFLLPLGEMLPVDRVLGMDFEVDASGRFSGRHAGISCAGAGKAEKIAAEAQGRRVRFACGNGSLDGPMMDLADQAWSVYPNPAFADHSRARGWPLLPRPPGFVEEAKFIP